MAHPDLIERLAHEPAPALSAPGSQVMRCSPAEQASSYCNGISLPISSALGQHLPENDQEFARTRHNRFGRRHPCGEVLVTCPPPD